MPEALTIVFALGAFMSTVLGLVGTAWWRIQASITKSGDATRAAVADLATQTREDVAKLERDMDTRFDALAARMALHESSLADHRTHVAETYISKEGLREMFKPVLATLSGIENRIGLMSERIDKLMDRERAPPR